MYVFRIAEYPRERKNSFPSSTSAYIQIDRRYLTMFDNVQGLLNVP